MLKGETGLEALVSLLEQNVEREARFGSVPNYASLLPAARAELGNITQLREALEAILNYQRAKDIAVCPVCASPREHGHRDDCPVPAARAALAADLSGEPAKEMNE